MNRKYNFQASLSWKKSELSNSLNKKTIIKSHIVKLEGKPKLALSAAKVFKGDPKLYNPEDLLLSSLVSCHMMSYLYVCSLHHIDILAYKDEAEAILETYTDGSGKIIEVLLNPNVVISDYSQIELALSLHKEAHKLCFIANSCNFEVKHSPKCTSIEST